MPGWVPALRLPPSHPSLWGALTLFCPPLPVKALPDSHEVRVMPLAMEGAVWHPQLWQMAFPQSPPSQPPSWQEVQGPPRHPQSPSPQPEALPNPAKASQCIFGCRLVTSPPCFCQHHSPGAAELPLAGRVCSTHHQHTACKCWHTCDTDTHSCHTHSCHTHTRNTDTCVTHTHVTHTLVSHTHSPACAHTSVHPHTLTLSHTSLLSHLFQAKQQFWKVPTRKIFLIQLNLFDLPHWHPLLPNATLLPWYPALGCYPWLNFGFIFCPKPLFRGKQSHWKVLMRSSRVLFPRKGLDFDQK